MEIIHNKDSVNCHYNAIVDLMNKSQELLIVTPFISSNLRLVPQNNLKNIKFLTLVTTLPPDCHEQEKKVNFFIHLLVLASQYGFILKVLIDDSLHAKVYIGKANESYTAIITSANFTKNGLVTNNEWGGAHP